MKLGKELHGRVLVEIMEASLMLHRCPSISGSKIVLALEGLPTVRDVEGLAVLLESQLVEQHVWVGYS